MSLVSEILTPARRHPALPHFAAGEWDWLRGALSTVDRSYGFLDHFFHHIADTHVRRPRPNLTQPCCSCETIVTSISARLRFVMSHKYLAACVKKRREVQESQLLGFGSSGAHSLAPADLNDAPAHGGRGGRPVLSRLPDGDDSSWLLVGGRWRTTCSPGCRTTTRARPPPC